MSVRGVDLMGSESLAQRARHVQAGGGGARLGGEGAGRGRERQREARGERRGRRAGSSRPASAGKSPTEEDGAATRPAPVAYPAGDAGRRRRLACLRSRGVGPAPPWPADG